MKSLWKHPHVQSSPAAEALNAGSEVPELSAPAQILEHHSDQLIDNREPASYYPFMFRCVCPYSLSSPEFLGASANVERIIVLPRCC